MRIGSVLALVLAACSGTPRVEPREPLEDPPVNLDSFADYHPSAEGCVFGDCRAGPYARRIDDRIISGTVGDAVVHLEWESGPCRGWSYRGSIVDDLPNGPGVLVPADRASYLQIAGQFERGALTGEADATVNLADGTQAHLRGELALDGPTCLVMFPDPGDLTLDAVKTGADAANVARFHGVVRAYKGLLAPWRGAFDTDPKRSGYVEFVADRWSIADAAVCLSGDCIDGPGVEHLGGGRFEIFEGEFVHGARHGRGKVFTVGDDGAGEQVVDYDGDGGVTRLERSRPRYTLIGSADGNQARFAGGNVDVQGLGLEPVVVSWDSELGMTGITASTVPTDIVAIANLPAKAEPMIAAGAVLKQELAHKAAVIRLETEYTDESTVAVTRGPRTAVIALIAGETRVEAAWLPATREYVIGRDLHMLDGKLSWTGRLTGTGTAMGAGGAAIHMVFYDGVRIDPLGFDSVRAYERASAKARIARARKFAKTAFATRAEDDRVVLALRRIRTGAATAFDRIAAAGNAIGDTGTTPEAWERVIRAGHAAVEQADNAIIDAAIGVDEAMHRLDSADPCVEPLATLGADLHDLDDRFRILLRGFDAFEYRNDPDRLQRIAAAFAADIAALSTAPIVEHLEQLRVAADGAPPPTPATLPKPKPESDEDPADATPASPPPP